MASFSIKSNPMVVAPAVFLLVLQLVAVVLAAETPSGGEQREFDYFVLALQWPATSCKNTGKCCPANGCCRGADSPTEFTIHGLWPQYNEKGWPSCCTDAISLLREDIEKYWPTYGCGTTSNCHGTKGSFWAHEKALSDAGFVASNTEKYPLEDVVDAVKNATNSTPKISCAKKGAVKELWICFDKKFEPRDCDLANSCPEFIKLPTYEPQDVVVFMVLAVTLPPQAAEGLTVGREQREFDYFVLALQWPGSSCRNVSMCCPTNGCCHRLVPCLKILTVTGQAIEKHGTCGSPVILHQYDYFFTTLALFFNYNVTYGIEDVFEAVRSAFNANPMLTCGRKGIIKELRLCFDKEFKLIDCDATKSCPKFVRLPEFHELSKPAMVKRAIPRMIDVEAIM
ncbi:Ribonuclease 2, partial [Cucurbita argyrosperma subsp. argyrosperma]